MKTYHKIMLGCALAAPALAITGGAQAQVSGIAVADPEAVILSAKALDAANATISTTFKPQLDQANARQESLQKELVTMGAPLDSNKDGRLSDTEIEAARAAKNPLLEKMAAAQQKGQAEIAGFNAPASRAQAWVLEQLSQKYGPAMKTVVDAKKISILLAANTVQFNAPVADVSDDIKAELDRTNPTLPIAPPANWQPSQQTLQLQQSFQQLVYLAAVQRARQAQAGGAPATPAPGKPAPAKPPVGR